MAYQFGHIEGYAREAGKGKTGNHSMASIVAEAERTDGACPHVATPVPPTLLYGVSPSEALTLAESWASQAKDARGHKLRKDGLCLLGGVVSLPADVPEKTWDKYKAQTLKWLKAEYGDCLKSVIEHTDEPHPHLHFYVVPRVGERFDSIHDGLRAAALANPARGNRKLSKEAKTAGKKKAGLAFAEAMRLWQDRFFKAVSAKFGFTRLGPRRRRLTRAEWKAEQRASKLQAEAVQKEQEELLKAKTNIMATQEAAQKAIAASVEKNTTILSKAMTTKAETEQLFAANPDRALYKKIQEVMHGIPSELNGEFWKQVKQLGQQLSLIHISEPTRPY